MINLVVTLRSLFQVHSLISTSLAHLSVCRVGGYCFITLLTSSFLQKIITPLTSSTPEETHLIYVCPWIHFRARCTSTMNHTKDNVAHTAPQRCKYQHQYENKIFHCKVLVNSYFTKDLLAFTPGIKINFRGQTKRLCLFKMSHNFSGML